LFVRKRTLATVRLGLALLLVVATAGRTAAATLEYQVKAAFLLSFVTFTEWPAAAFESPASPLQLCVLHENPFDASLAGTVRGERAGGHPLTVVQINKGEDARGCHVLFVPQSVDEGDAVAARAAADTPVLMVAESPALERAATIVFSLENGRVRFDVNRTAAERSGLHLSSKLLRNARVVR